MSKSPDAFRTISEVAEWLDTPAHVLRFWESRFSQIKPLKRAGGRRYYRPSDMRLIGGIKKLLHEDGVTIRGVQKILREQGIRHVVALSPEIEPAPPKAAAAPGDGATQAIAAGDEPPAEPPAELTAQLAAAPPAEPAEPALAEVPPAEGHDPAEPFFDFGDERFETAFAPSEPPAELAREPHTPAVPGPGADGAASVSGSEPEVEARDDAGAMDAGTALQPDSATQKDTGDTVSTEDRAAAPGAVPGPPQSRGPRDLSDRVPLPTRLRELADIGDLPQGRDRNAMVAFHSRLRGLRDRVAARI